MIRTVLFLSLVSCTFARMAYWLPGGVSYGREEAYKREFSCEDHDFGFYADVANNCELYHLCEPVFDNEGNFIEVAHYSFACGAGTIFSQRDLGCNHIIMASSCEDAPSIYESSNVGSGVQLVARNEIIREEDDYLYDDDDDDE